MTNEAQRHLDKAAKLLAKGDDFYALAADEIIAAQKADPALSNREIGETFNRSKEWVRAIVTWRTTGEPDGPMQWRRGSHATTKEIEQGAEKLLAEAPLEQVERIIDSLPPERKLAVAAAAGSGYDKARFEEDERVKNLTPAERKEIEAAKAGIAGPIDKALGGFATLGVVGHIEQATEDLSQMIADNAITAESIYRIEQAHALFVTELEVAKAMAGLGEESFA